MPLTNKKGGEIPSVYYPLFYRGTDRSLNCGNQLPSCQIRGKIMLTSGESRQMPSKGGEEQNK